MHDNPTKPIPPHQPLVLYDGECGFCNASIRFILRHEKTPRLHFAPLQGTTAAPILARCGLPPDTGHSTIVVATAHHCHIRSNAVITIMKHMGGPWPLLATITKIIPRPLRDLIYNQVARHRHHLLPTATCQPLPPHQQKRFLP